MRLTDRGSSNIVQGDQSVSESETRNPPVYTYLFVLARKNLVLIFEAIMNIKIKLGNNLNFGWYIDCPVKLFRPEKKKTLKRLV